jgi:hypothetical protein
MPETLKPLSSTFAMLVEKTASFLACSLQTAAWKLQWQTKGALHGEYL